mmetsp:Transcript_23787/g.59048  ORF Transcript_23787/g.59048 Transcript_23787/m.59048 type:complete len:300 (+) Transcript_23787:354-1253(+)
MAVRHARGARGLVGRVPREYLWRGVVWRAAQAHQQLPLLRVDHARVAKVDELDRRVRLARGEDEVVRLDVAVNDALLVQVGDGAAHLEDERRGVRLAEWPLLLDPVEEVSAAQVLQHEEVLLAPLVRADQLDDPFVPHRVKDPHLREHLSLRLRERRAQLRVVQVHHLHRVALRRALRRRAAHLREAAPAERGVQRVARLEVGDLDVLRQAFGGRRRGGEQLHVVVWEEAGLPLQLAVVPAVVFFVRLEHMDHVVPLEAELIVCTCDVVVHSAGGLPRSERCHEEMRRRERANGGSGAV